MLDGPLLPPLQRSQGQASASFAQRHGATFLTDLHQSGSAKILLPRTHLTAPEVFFLNTSGGLTSGDRLDLTLSLGRPQPPAGLHPNRRTRLPCARWSGAGHHHRRCWRGQPAGLDAAGNHLVYQASHLIRRTNINLAADAQCLLAETVILGRHAMGEVVTNASLLNHRLIRRAGRPVWAESLHLTPETLASDGPALLNRARACAVVCLVAQGAEDAVAPLRAALPDLAISGWDGKCVVRLTAADGWPLKQQQALVLHILTGRPLPRVLASGAPQ